MRLTRETLIKIARDTALQRAKVSRRIICIYLTGSVLSEEPLLGGTTDIDLIIIHDSEPLQQREIVRISDEVHLDISHYPQSMFQQPRHLRADPWLGPFIYRKPMVFHETGHWFDFTQASAGAQFFQPDYILQRAGKLGQAARQAWMRLEMTPNESHPARVFAFLETLENAGNALVSLTGEGNPLAERRFLLQLPLRLQELGRPDLISGLTGLLAADATQLEAVWPEWTKNWKAAFIAASTLENAPPRLHPARQPYYERAAAALWEENTAAAAWLLFRSWTLAAGLLPADSAAVDGWRSACTTLGLDAERFPERLEALDRYLDQVEEALDNWGRDNGVSELPEG